MSRRRAPQDDGVHGRDQLKKYRFAWYEVYTTEHEWRKISVSVSGETTYFRVVVMTISSEKLITDRLYAKYRRRYIDDYGHKQFKDVWQAKSIVFGLNLSQKLTTAINIACEEADEISQTNPVFKKLRKLHKIKKILED